MRKNKNLIYAFLVFVLVLGWLFIKPQEQEDDFPERVKVALREVGHQLLLADGDSTSLVLPVIQWSEHKYGLSFQNELSLKPDDLVVMVRNSFKKSTLPNYYRVEVKDSKEQVGYSYEIKNHAEKDIIPCFGRFLPVDHYTIEVGFTEGVIASIKNWFFAIVLILLVIVFIWETYFFRGRRKNKPLQANNEYKSIGSYDFFPEQSKLVRGTKEISLSKKECELLVVFVEYMNQIIKREELSKQVWENNGVFVGRSLDTYISKLRKKLKDDEAVKLINVHGVGYKLEAN